MTILKEQEQRITEGTLRAIAKFRVILRNDASAMRMLDACERDARAYLATLENA